jgi:hypothetical protein
MVTGEDKTYDISIVIFGQTKKKHNLKEMLLLNRQWVWSLKIPLH